MLDHRRMAYAYVSEAVGDLAVVEMQMFSDASETYPLVVVGTSPPAYVANGPLGGAHRFAITCAVYGTDLEETWSLALTIEQRIHALYAERFVTDYGGITHINRARSLRPNAVSLGELSPTDDAYRFDFDIYVTARAPVAGGTATTTNEE